MNPSHHNECIVRISPWKATHSNTSSGGGESAIRCPLTGCKNESDLEVVLPRSEFEETSSSDGESKILFFDPGEKASLKESNESRHPRDMRLEHGGLSVGFVRPSDGIEEAQPSWEVDDQLRWVSGVHSEDLDGPPWRSYTTREDRRAIVPTTTELGDGSPHSCAPTPSRERLSGGCVGQGAQREYTEEQRRDRRRSEKIAARARLGA
ncbi:hypothetical protein FA13DRAFT_1712514 [Coprinellus micaceus]|uniref:Uncharacterized protein n=1 Tax=Coprinellus micaceus TaxID=71717 RepID=A0A4Y7T0E6_COPMI|nr:hypothetical protein FA13DRAFT_1712514 [Coprinellus micaceus]